jgi:hypothetical protein
MICKLSQIGQDLLCSYRCSEYSKPYREGVSVLSIRYTVVIDNTRSKTMAVGPIKHFIDEGYLKNHFFMIFSSAFVTHYSLMMGSL